MSMTHAQLVERASRWLKNSRRCGLIVTELCCWDQEIPDALGWYNGGFCSILIECKTSLSDFYADGKKPSRRNPNVPSIGQERYYMAEKGVLTPELIKKHRVRWGLLEVCGSKVRVVLKAVPCGMVCRTKETPYLYSIIRRHSIRLHRGDRSENILAR